MFCKFSFSLFVFIVGFCQIQAQVMQEGGGEYRVKSANCVSKEQYEKIYAQLEHSRQQLQARGILPVRNRSAQMQFGFPLRQAASYNYSSFYGISNFVDHNVNVPNLLSDYNCGNRTYDQSSGYNHQGIDYFLWPFDNLMQQRSQVEIIAAEAGTILYKSDGNADQNCAFCTTCDWNAVYLQHADGSVTWYGHMKKNSLTSKAIGASVAKGEYLGAVGSSGISTGPHLHFEIYKASPFSRSNLIDPNAGTCNLLNGTNSWWQVQPAYYEPRIAQIQTQSAPVNFGVCPAPETTNEVSQVVQGQTVYFSMYFSDQLSGTSANGRITRPDNSLFQSWVQNFTDTYTASWWWRSYTIPANAPTGDWNFQLTYNGKTVNYSFKVTAATSDRPVDQTQQQFTVYPNPFVNELTIRSNERFRNPSVSIYNLQGKKVFHRQFSTTQQYSVTLAGLQLSGGAYWVIISENQKTVWKQLITH